MRLDRWFRVHFPDITYGHLQKLLRSGQVRVNSRRAQANARRGERPAGARAGRPPRCRPRRSPSLAPPLGLSKGDRDFIEAMILYEDEDVLVLNKPFGIAVQGGTGTKRHIDGMLAGMADRFGDRPRLVHRLDRDTTGVLLVAKHRDAAAKLGRIFQTPLGRQDLLGAGQGRAEAAAGQGRGGAGQGRRPRRRGPRAQGAARRAGQGDARHHALLGDRPRRAQGVMGVAQARHRPPAPAARAHGADRQPDRRRQQVRGRQGAGRQRHRGQAAPARPPPGHPASRRAATSTSRPRCPTTCARRGSCWASTPAGSTPTQDE